MSGPLEFVCVPQQQYSRVTLREWLAERRADGRAPAEGPVEVRVLHPLREADGSCRWCGAGPDETVRMG